MITLLDLSSTLSNLPALPALRIVKPVDQEPPKFARTVEPRTGHRWQAINPHNWVCSVCGIVGYRIASGEIGTTYECGEYLTMAVMDI